MSDGFKARFYDGRGNLVEESDTREFLVVRDEMIEEVKATLFEALQDTDWRWGRYAERKERGIPQNPLDAALFDAREQARVLSDAFEASLNLARNLSALDQAWEVGYPGFQARLDAVFSETGKLGGGPRGGPGGGGSKPGTVGPPIGPVGLGGIPGP